MLPELESAVRSLARQTQGLSDELIGQPYRWRAHQEGLRFALIGSYQELHDLAARLAEERAQAGPPRTVAQRVLAPYHEAYRELQALLLGVGDELYDQEPAEGEWPLRTVLGHIVAAERVFFSLVHYGAARLQAAQEMPVEFPGPEETDRLTGSRSEFEQIWDGSLEGLLEYYEKLHRRVLEEFSQLEAGTLQALSVWWEEEPLSLRYRLHRFDAHLRQHTIQAEKTLDAIRGFPVSEARRLLRLVYRALAEVESVCLGAPECGRAERERLAQQLEQRAVQVAETVAAVQAVREAVATGDAQTLEALLQEDADLAATTTPAGRSLILEALHEGQTDVAAILGEAHPELAVWEAAALGHLDIVQQGVAEWAGWLEYANKEGQNPLHLAAMFGREALVRWLLGEGADATLTDAEGQNALDLARAGGHETVAQLLAAEV